MSERSPFPGTAACAACAALPEPGLAAGGADAGGRAGRGPGLRRVEIALPRIHCASCIAGVEQVLGAVPGVAAARVNLTRKRVTVTAHDLPDMQDRLVAALDGAGFEAAPLSSAALEETRGDPAGRALLARIGVAGFALMNVMLLSISVWSGADATTRDLMHWLSAAIALPATAFAAQPFLANAWRALRAGRLDMDVPISTAILLALGVSLRETLASGEHAFFDAALMLTFFLLIGRYLAHATRASARSAAAEVAALEVRMADRIGEDGRRETVPVEALRPGDLVVVTPGGRIPADGIVTEGSSEIDPSMLTGETMPEAAAPGGRVRAGMTNLSAPLTIRVDALGEETLLQQIGRLVEAAEQSRGRYASLASRASRWYSHSVNALAVAALAVWGLIGQDWNLALRIAAAVLIITCPCALGLAVPAVLTAASGRLFRRGVLLKDGEAFERLGEIDTVVFDKTGTLTTGAPRLVAIEPRAAPRADAAARSVAARDALALSAALARDSAHPLSRAIFRAAEAAEIPPAAIVGMREYPGLGAEAWSGGTRIRLGRAEWVLAGPDEDRSGAEGGETGGEAETRTTAWLAAGTRAPVRLVFEDTARPEAAQTVARLKRAGLAVELLSGDAEGPVRALAAETGIEDWTARATPAGKVAHLEALAARGRRVLMVGDGLNDAAALASASVSMSPASAVDASRSAADLILLGNRIDEVAGAIVLARRARRRIRENVALAFAYNIVTVPIAFAGLVTPLVAAIAMSLSSVVVSLNALRLGRRA